MNIFNLIWFDIVCSLSILIRTITQVEILVYVVPTTIGMAFVVYPIQKFFFRFFEKNYFSFMPKIVINFFVTSAINFGISIIISYYILLVFALTQEIYRYGYNLTDWNFIQNYLLHFGIMLPFLILVVFVVKKVSQLWTNGWLS